MPTSNVNPKHIQEGTEAIIKEAKDWQKIVIMNWYEDPVYIKQCEKAVEIQSLKPNEGYPHSIYYCHAHGLGCDVDSSIWLPRQDQLQEMLGYRHPMSGVKNIGRWLDNLHGEEYLGKIGWSMEQLWFAFVMKEKYNKVWTGEDWLKELQQI